MKPHDRHHQLAIGPLPVQSLSRARESAAPVQGKEIPLTTLLADSVEATGCTEKEAALAQGYGAAYWSRVKTGEKAAHLDRLARLPVHVQREFVKRYAHQLKMTVREEDARARAISDLAAAAVRALQEIVA